MPLRASVLFVSTVAEWRERRGSTASVGARPRHVRTPVSCEFSRSVDGRNKAAFRKINEIFNERAPIADVVGEKVALTSKGQRLSGLCPFHNEKTPSFTVFEESSSYYCFGCHEGGGIIDFVRKAKDIGYWDAVKYISDKFNLQKEVEPYLHQTPRSRAQINAAEEAARKADLLREVCEKAASWYAQNLWTESAESKEALEYLKKRNFNAETLRHFQIGVSLQGSAAFFNHMVKGCGYSIESLLETGIATRLKDGNVIEFMNNRLIIPIHDSKGRAIGFGGRKLKDNDWGPKYLNTRESEIFSKGEILFAEHMLPPATPPATAVIVEGYLDAIRLHQEGCPWAVASLGTGLNLSHLRLAARHSREKAVTINMDSDNAGIASMLRACEAVFPNAMREGIDVRLALMPNSFKDADEYLDLNSVQSYVTKVLATSESWFLWYTRRLAENVQGAESMLSLLNRLGSLLASAIPPRREGTGFVVKEYAIIISKVLVDVFGRPDLEHDAVKIITRSFWVTRTGGKFDPHRSQDTSDSSSFRGSSDRKYKQIRDSRATELQPNDHPSNSAHDDGDNISVQHVLKTELTLLRLLVQNISIRSRVFSEVEDRGIKFLDNVNWRFFQWLRDNAVDADTEELYEELHLIGDFDDINIYFDRPPHLDRVDQETEKSLLIMEIHRNFKILAAIDVKLAEKMEVIGDPGSENAKLANMYFKKRQNIQDRITVLRERVHILSDFDNFDG
eukprot:Plantae.Rhodophyta-Purpureofilum_apyrenoidigerum.ctg20869.p1 GENE.Plantae.Rhodophyta-Purpureofilum_apyrenoidigerum.ctg20869~~Plantae.Rhodophyta-Purpureofilum_apyrenoidigerum.ctg20869.p1  ORF type:complete len:734 (-),score=123.63 Plantae.Rhodophyta-Purpureofilum_apyrenoidigerum.ctg20869:999-3200(-)